MHDHHHHHHDHSHGHVHAPASYNRAFAIGIALNSIYIIVETVAGFSFNSMALLADAGHNVSDVFALLLAWGASCLALRPASVRRTYGLRKTSILASLTNAIILLIAIGAIAWEAILRFARPAAVSGDMMMVVAAIGVVVNGATALLFVKNQHHDLNIKGAYLHMAADAGVSVGVVLAGLAISLTGLTWIDPVVSLLIVAVIAVGTWGLLRDSVALALDAVPPDIDPDAVRDYLARQPGVTGVHDLHIWAMSTTTTALTAHLVVPDPAHSDALLRDLAAGLEAQFHIVHPTIQIERADDCRACDRDDPAPPSSDSPPYSVVAGGSAP